jgi:hypothetical protein
LVSTQVRTARSPEEIISRASLAGLAGAMLAVGLARFARTMVAAGLGGGLSRPFGFTLRGCRRHLPLPRV